MTQGLSGRANQSSVWRPEGLTLGMVLKSSGPMLPGRRSVRTFCGQLLVVVVGLVLVVSKVLHYQSLSGHDTGNQRYETGEREHCRKQVAADPGDGEDYAKGDEEESADSRQGAPACSTPSKRVSSARHLDKNSSGRRDRRILETPQLAAARPAAKRGHAPPGAGT